MTEPSDEPCVLPFDEVDQVDAPFPPTIDSTLSHEHLIDYLTQDVVSSEAPCISSSPPFLSPSSSSSSQSIEVSAGLYWSIRSAIVALRDASAPPQQIEHFEGEEGGPDAAHTFNPVTLEPKQIHSQAALDHVVKVEHHAERWADPPDDTKRHILSRAEGLETQRSPLAKSLHSPPPPPGMPSSSPIDSLIAGSTSTEHSVAYRDDVKPNRSVVEHLRGGQSSLLNVAPMVPTKGKRIYSTGKMPSVSEMECEAQRVGQPSDLPYNPFSSKLPKFEK